MKTTFLSIKLRIIIYQKIIVIRSYLTYRSLQHKKDKRKKERFQILNYICIQITNDFCFSLQKLMFLYEKHVVNHN